MKHKKLFISLTAILTVFLALAIFLVIWFWGDSYKSTAKYDGFETFRAEAAIPGLKDGACPQGIASYTTTYNVDQNGESIEKTQLYFFISAYFDNAPSRLYVVGKNTGLVGYVTMKTPEGEVYDGHCGGVATNGYTFWMVSGKTVYCAKKDGSSTATDNIARDIIKLAEENGVLEFTASFHANLNASFCYFYDADGSTASQASADRLYVGEFYRPGNYETDERHHVTTKQGYENRAFVYEYNISTSSSNKYGLTLISSENVAEENYVPRVQNVYSITNEIQGFARTMSGGLILSQSYGLKNSHILYYDWAKITHSDNRQLYKNLEYVVKDKDGNVVKNEDGTDKKQAYGGFSYEGVLTKSGAPYKDTGSIYIYYADKASILNDYSIPSMSEGLCVSNDRVYVLFESGAKKYKMFVRQFLNDIYSFIPRTKK